MALDFEDARELAERYTAAWCSRDPAAVAAFYAPDGWIAVNEGVPAVGRRGVTGVARGFMETFPDMVVTMDDFVERDGVFEYHWTLDGTNSGPGGTGKRVHISGFEALTIGADGLIAQSRGSFDEAEYERQLELGA